MTLKNWYQNNNYKIYLKTLDLFHKFYLSQVWLITSSPFVLFSSNYNSINIEIHNFYKNFLIVSNKHFYEY